MCVTHELNLPYCQSEQVFVIVCSNEELVLNCDYSYVPHCVYAFVYFVDDDRGFLCQF